MSYDSCYIFDPITPNREKIFDLLIRRIPYCDKILDLGSGPIGYYWAMAYAHKVNSIHFFDSNEEFLKASSHTINILNPAYFEKNFTTTIEYFQANKLLQYDEAKIPTLLEHIITKIQAPEVYNFLYPPKQKNYFDVVLAIESIECVDSIAQLETVIKNIHTLLKPGGSLLQYSLQYSLESIEVVSSIQHGTEGRLNPSYNLSMEILRQTGFTIQYNHCEAKTYMQNYGMASYIHAVK